jgi:hypothetical protein
LREARRSQCGGLEPAALQDATTYRFRLYTITRGGGGNRTRKIVSAKLWPAKQLRNPKRRWQRIGSGRFVTVWHCLTVIVYKRQISLD